MKEKVWGRFDRGWKGLSVLSKVLIAVALIAFIVLGPFVFIWAWNTLLGQSVPLSLWPWMTAFAIVITVAGLAARMGRGSSAARWGPWRITGIAAIIAGIVGVGLSVVGLLSFTIGFTNLYLSPWGPGTPIGPIVVLGWLWGGALFVAGSLMLRYDRKMKASPSPTV